MPSPRLLSRTMTYAVFGAALFAMTVCAQAECIKRSLREDAYAFKLRVSSTTGYFKVNIGTGPTHGECPDYRVNFIGRKTLAGNPAQWKSVREEACFVIGEGGAATELAMEWDVVVPFIPDSGLGIKVFPSGSAGTVRVSVHDFAGKEFLAQDFNRSNGILAAPKSRLPPPGGLASILPAKPPLAAKMGAYLFPWYGLPSGPTKALTHWNAGGFLFHPKIGQYDSGDPEVIRQQMDWAVQAEFNLLVLSYWDKEGSNRNTGPILEGAAEAGLEISAMLETVVRRPGVSPRDCFLAQIQEIQRDYAPHRAWLKSGGKPVIFVYDRIVKEMKAAYGDTGGTRWWDDWLWVKSETEKGGMGVLLMVPIAEGITPDHVKAMGGGSVFAANSGAGNPWVGADHEDWKWSWTAAQGGGLSALPILPRFERGHLPEDIPNYRNQWRAARAAMPDIILVNSWNEYHESSVIEPTAEFGEDWLRLSAREAATFCRGELGPLTPKDSTGIPPAALRPSRSGSRQGNMQVSVTGDGYLIRVPELGVRIAAVHGLRGEILRELPVRGGMATWDGRDSRGAKLAPGLYWIKAGSARIAILPR